MLHRQRFTVVLIWVAAIVQSQSTDERHDLGPPCRDIKHVHLALGEEPSTSMTLSFSSSACASSNALWSSSGAPVGIVEIGTSPDNMSRSIMGTQPPNQYLATLPRKLGNYTSDFFHHITVKDLKPNTRYFYQCSARTQGTVVSREQMRDEAFEADNESIRHLAKSVQMKHGSFVTAPLPGTFHDTRGKRFKFVMMGDLGHYEKSISTMKHLDDNNRLVSAIILAGDLAYSQGNHMKWDTWFDLLDRFPVFRQVSLQIACGNHDVDITEASGEIFTAYENRFRMPAIQPAIRKALGSSGSWSPSKFLSHVPYPLEYDYGNAYYAYTYGPSRFIILSSYSNFDPGSKQDTWLVDELEKVDRSITPWLIVIMHVPIYNTFAEHRNDVQLIKAQEILEPFFVKHHVNIVFSGHVHAYMRTHNVAYGKVKDTGPIHIIAGDGGRPINSPFFNAEPEEWVATRDSTVFGYGTFEIHNSTTAEWRWIHTSNDDSNDRNTVSGDNTTTFPRGGRDHVYIDNQYFLSQAQDNIHG